MVRHDAHMSERRPHTKVYSVRARDTLGLAVTRAREAAGHQHRPSFAKEARISVRSLLKLETGEPVGAQVYESVARALPGWTEDTPRAILDGGQSPPTTETPQGGVEPDVVDVADLGQVRNLVRSIIDNEILTVDDKTDMIINVFQRRQQRVNNPSRKGQARHHG